MQGVRQELMHNTPEQVLAYVRAGLAVVEELDPPDDLRAAVFTAAVNLASSKSISLQPVGLGNGLGMAIPRGV